MRTMRRNGRAAGTAAGHARGALIPALYDEVRSIRIVDTHEHLEEEAAHLAAPPNLARLFTFYAAHDLVSAGLDEGSAELLADPGAPIDRQWSAIRAYWPLVRHTGAGRAVTLAIRGLYGVHDLEDATLPALERAMRARQEPGLLRWILRERSGIECCLVHSLTPPRESLRRTTADPALMLLDLSVGEFLRNDLDLGAFQKETGISCGSLEDWRRIVDSSFDRHGRWVAGIKNNCAYWRDLRFAEVEDGDAERAFQQWPLGSGAPPPEVRRAVQDWTFHHCIRRAISLDLPVRIHTGYLAGNGYMDMGRFRVRDLQPLFHRYPRARFDIFHVGYPEWTDVVALAKHYANVYANLCWTWVLDFQAAREFARAALHALPLNKVFAFGGDYRYADAVHGHAQLARDGMARVLTEAVRDGWLELRDAKKVARRWLRENAMEFFRIDDLRSRIGVAGAGRRLAAARLTGGVTA